MALLNLFRLVAFSEITNRHSIKWQQNRKKIIYFQEQERVRENESHKRLRDSTKKKSINFNDGLFWQNETKIQIPNGKTNTTNGNGERIERRECEPKYNNGKNNEKREIERIQNEKHTHAHSNM